MSDKTLSGSIALTKLIHVKIKSKKGADCLMIPIEANLLETDANGGVYIPVRVITKDQQDQYGQNGFIAKSIGSKHYKAADQAQRDKWKADGKEITPILGSIKDFTGGGSQDASSGAAAEGTFTEDDDLPF